jgi:predicted dehydrogenase
MKTITVGTIGTSMITGKFLEAVGEVEGIECGAVYSRSLEKAQEYAAAHGVETAYDSLEALFAAPELDAIYIASPNLLHKEQALAAIAAGKHVLVEKPMGVNAAECEEIIAAAREAGVVAMEAMRTVHDPTYVELKAAMARIGRVRRGTFRYDKYSSRYDLVREGKQTNIFDPRLATGSMMDLGVYSLNAMVYLLGAPDDLHACVDTVEVEGGTIDIAGSVVATYDGCIGEAAWSKCTAGALGSQLEGEDATITWSAVSEPFDAKIVWHDGREEPVGLQASPAHHEEVSNMRFEVEDFAAACRGNFDVAPYNQLCLDVRRMMDQLRFENGIVFAPDAVEIEN